MCLQCGWEAPDLHEALGARPPPTGLHRKVIAGIALMLLAMLLSLATLIASIAVGGKVWFVFTGGIVGGLTLVRAGIADRRSGRG